MEVKVRLNPCFPGESKHSMARLDFGDGRGAPGDLVLEIVTSKSIPLSFRTFWHEYHWLNRPRRPGWGPAVLMLCVADGSPSSVSLRNLSAGGRVS